MAIGQEGSALVRASVQSSRSRYNAFSMEARYSGGFVPRMINRVIPDTSITELLCNLFDAYGGILEKLLTARSVPSRNVK